MLAKIKQLISGQYDQPVLRNRILHLHMQQTPYPEKIRKKIEHVIEILKYGKLTDMYTKELGIMEMFEIDSNNPNNNVVSI